MKWDAGKYDAIEAPQIDAGRELLELSEVRPSDAVLDIGCGTGRLTRELARLASGGSVVGIDPSEEMLAHARTPHEGQTQVEYFVMGAEDMPFADAFDLAFSNSALQWVKPQEEVLSLVSRALRKGGRIAFQFPAKDFCREFFAYADQAITVLGLEDRFSGWESPWRFFSSREYASMLSAAGFANVRVVCREYRCCFRSINDVLAWWSSAGLRPYLAVLPPEEQEYFGYAVAMNYEKNRTDRGIEFGFKRLFALAEKER